MTVIDVHVPALHAGQREILESKARFKVLNCGRRYGKTTLAESLIVREALKTSKPFGYFAPTYKYLRDVWSDLKRVLYPVTEHKSEVDRVIELINGGKIECWTLDDPNAGRSRKYAGVVIDEAAMVPKLQEAWQDSIRATLADYEGWALFASTPKGRNYFYTLYRRGVDPENTEWQSWHFPTRANPFIQEAEIEAARTELPEMSFRQEWLAEFLEGEGTVFRRVAECATAEQTTPYPGEFIAGVDWGKQNDFTVIVVLDRNGRMVDIDRFNQIDYHVQRQRIEAMCNRWGIGQVVCELNSMGQPNFEELQRAGLPVMGFTTTATSKPPLIESLVLAFERGEIEIFNDPVLIGELEAYESKVNAVTGRSTYSAPDGQHDDTVMALALAWHAVSTPVLDIL